MCGIAGAVGLQSRPQPALSDAVRGTMEHRGPDCGDEWWDGLGTWLGFRRLAVIDVRDSAGQPMVDAESGVAIVFNGEIYNYVELRDELIRRGHHFRTNGDTEVVLRGWIEWGESLFDRCNGMWALAIADPGRRGVLLCRDRFGEKPLHYGRDAEGAWWFASEPATLRAANVGTGRVDASRVASLLLLGHLDDVGETWFDGIAQVPPGHTVRLTKGGPSAALMWWDLGRFVHERWDERPLEAEEVLARLDDSVRLRLRSDVEVGTSLSGGVDSSAVVASLRAVDPERSLHGFTASFPGYDVDEWDRASIVSRRNGVTLHRVEPTVDGFLEDLDRLVHHQGGPIEGPTVYAQWCVMAAAREAGVVVLLDGQGADESWGGYRKYVGTALIDAVIRRDALNASAIRTSWGLQEGVPRPKLAPIAGLLVGRRGRQGIVNVRRRTTRDWLGEALLDVKLPDPLPPEMLGGLLERTAVSDLGHVVLPRLLRYSDRNSMAHSCEVRLPFLDPLMLDAAFRSGWTAGFGTGWTKAALREAVRPRVPREVLELRAKFAYQAPDNVWLADQRVRDAVLAASNHLQSLGVIAAGFPVERHPWKILSLSRLFDLYDLRP